MTEARPIPYPADTSAKGWRFELDYERIDQSDTWDLAAEVPMAQAALLMMWLVAWRQKPCGSLPADEEVIRSKCRIPVDMWERCRRLCLRGWWLAEDGRLYQDTLVERVLAMLAKRAKDAGRTAARREREAGKAVTHTEATDVSRVTPDGLTHEFDTKHQAPEPEPSTKEKKRRVAALTLAELVADGLTEVTAQGWLDHRTAKGAKLTALAWKGFKAEVDKAPGWTVEAAVLKAIARNWTGFEASWVLGDTPSRAGTLNRQEALEQRNRTVAENWAAQGQQENFDENH